jgi:ECF transporter S component (folate family)
MQIKTKEIVLAGLFIAISVLLTRVFSANLYIAGVNSARLAVGFVPIMLAGILLGPALGMCVGALADVLGFLLFPTGMYFPLVTLTSAIVGLLPWAVYRLAAKCSDWLKTLLAVSITQVVCSMFMQTLWLSIMFGKSYEILFWPRAIIALIMIPVFFVIIQSVLAGLKKAKVISKANEV